MVPHLVQAAAQGTELELFRTLMEQSLSGIYVFDAARFLFVNSRFAEIFGYSREEVLALPSVLDTVADADRPLVAEQIRRRLAGEAKQLQYTFRGQRKDGSVVHVEVNGSRTEYRGQTVIAGILLDITEQKELEERFLQMQKMEAVGQLAGGVAHDFKNLLMAINGYSELLLQSQPLSEPARQLAEEIHSAGERAALLTRQLLAFSRKSRAEPRAVDLNALVSDAERLLRALLGKEVELEMALAPDVGAVAIDPGQMEQVLFNLVVNCRDAMPQGGKLTIETANAELDGTVHAGRCSLLAVSDTGVGMPAEIQAHIFEPFFTTKEKGKGTGLGLTTVHDIVVRHGGGHVAVQSAPGQGTTFRVYLPHARSGLRRTRKVKSRVAHLPRGTETVLLVEDEAVVRTLSRYTLLGCGYTVLEAVSGGDALRIAGLHPGPIHLLLADLLMARLSGAALVAGLREKHPALRVLYVSGSTDDPPGLQGLLQGEVAVLAKPFTPSALAHKVREVLDAKLP
jgi:PAS domain S-box-containing protein